jgi:hypothetical protein
MKPCILRDKEGQYVGRLHGGPHSLMVCGDTTSLMPSPDFEPVASFLYPQVPGYTALFNGNSVVFHRPLRSGMPRYMALPGTTVQTAPYKVSANR